MPNELHLSLFPGLNLNRDESGQWGLELGFAHAPAATQPSALPETPSANQATEALARLGANAAPAGLGLFAPRLSPLDAIGINRFHIENSLQSLTGLIALQQTWDTILPEQLPVIQSSLFELARVRVQDLEGEVRRLETQSGFLGGQARAARRLMEVSADFPLPQEEAPAPVDSEELVQARADLARVRSLKTSLEGPTQDPDQLDEAAQGLTVEIDAAVRGRIQKLFDQVSHPELRSFLNATSVGDVDAYRHLTNETERLSYRDHINARVSTLQTWGAPVSDRQGHLRDIAAWGNIHEPGERFNQHNEANVATPDEATKRHRVLSFEYSSLLPHFEAKREGESEVEFAARLTEGRKALSELEQHANLPQLQSESQAAQSFNHYYRFAQSIAVTSVAAIPAMLAAGALAPAAEVLLGTRIGAVVTRLTEGAVFVGSERGLNSFLGIENASQRSFGAETVRSAGMFEVLGIVQGGVTTFLRDVGAGPVASYLSLFATEVAALGGYDFSAGNVENAVTRGTFDPVGVARETLSAEAWENRLASLVGLRVAGAVTHPVGEALQSEVQARVERVLPRLAAAAERFLPRTESMRPTLLATAAMALAGCDSEQALNMIPVFGVAAVGTAWIQVVGRRIAGAIHGEIREAMAARSAAMAEPVVDPNEVVNQNEVETQPGVNHAELGRGRVMAALNTFLARFTIQHVRTLAHARDPQSTSAPKLPMYLMGDPGRIEVTVPLDRPTPQFPTPATLMEGIYRQARLWANELNLSFVPGPRTSSPSEPRTFSLQDGQGQVVMRGRVALAERPTSEPSSPNTPGVATQAAGLMGLALMLGGCDASQTPTAVDAVTALGALAALGTNVVAEPVLQANETAHTEPAEETIAQRERPRAQSHTLAAGPLRRLVADAFSDSMRPFRAEYYSPEDSLLVLRVPTGGRPEATRWLVSRIGARVLEVRNGSVLGGDFRVGEPSIDPTHPSGTSLHVLVVEGPGSPEITRAEMTRLLAPSPTTTPSEAPTQSNVQTGDHYPNDPTIPDLGEGATQPNNRR